MRTEPPSRLRTSVAWVAIPLAGALWHLHNLRGTWWFFDEWSVIERVSHRAFFEGVTTGFNGHLWMPTYVLYRAQVSQFGIERHAFVMAAYVLVLVALDLAIAAVLRASSVPLLVALPMAALVTYLGVAGQNLLFVVQASSMLAMALCAAATALVLRRPPTRTTLTIVGVVLLCAVGADSGYALSGIVLASIVAVLTWSWRRAWPALVPSDRHNHSRANASCPLETFRFDQR